ncbi:nucleotidyltransferase domain-containing protein, partial [Micrococcus sp. SIMBA_144]
VNNLILSVQKEMTTILNDDLVGIYIHGSIAMGGFNPDQSDIDVLVITNKAIEVESKRELASFFLKCSNSPYPIEISFMNQEQLKFGKHPCAFECHYSE